MALEVFMDRLRQQYADQVLHVILFGSKVRGDFDAESDLDLLVVVESPDWRVHQQVSHLAYEPMVEHDTVLSTHTIGRDLYAKMRLRRTPLFRNVSQEGVELWTSQPHKTSATISN